MFSLFSLRRFAPSAFILLVMLFLSSALLLIGCKDEPDPVDDQNKLNQNLIGTWASEYFDGYIISSTKISYDDGSGIDYAGTIRYVSNFSSTAGIIIIEYDADKKPTYYEGFDPITWEPIGDPLPLNGNFIGIYYKDLKPGVSVQMGAAYVDGGAETATLNEAKAEFTMGNEGSYITWYGTYSWQ
jgi:hypothetical protein